MLRFFIVIVVVAASIGQAQAMTRTTFDKINRAAQAAYAMGVVQGLQFANIHLELEGQSRIFCEPEGGYLSPEQMHSMAVSSGINSDPEYPVEMLLMEALRSKFPCS